MSFDGAVVICKWKKVHIYTKENEKETERYRNKLIFNKVLKHVMMIVVVVVEVVGKQTEENACCDFQLSSAQLTPPLPHSLSCSCQKWDPYRHPCLTANASIEWNLGLATPVPPAASFALPMTK
ncbi:hypothetical protein F8388_012457 [Cannabis sativa]|uniref:Uncharacterized protein n=1 Tax=Cannabis sativa TaxID=3483 RepID=A0A7J6H1F9_CANSA|nr:hypothetical protein F8388_012457 [Cannabis sativa]